MLEDARYTLKEAAEYIKCSQSKLRRLIKSKEGPKYYMVGSTYIFRESKIIEWIERLEKGEY